MQEKKKKKRNKKKKPEDIGEWGTMSNPALRIQVAPPQPKPEKFLIPRLKLNLINISKQLKKEKVVN